MSDELSPDRWWVTGARDEMAQREITHEPMVGWRGWHVVADGNGHRLVSWWLNTEWAPRERTESVCDEHGSLPDREHDCGIHAFMDREEALAYIGQRVPFVGYPFVRQVEGRVCLAIGRVSLWGRVVQHERGYRGQFAYPYDIFLIDGTPAIARSLASRYAVDVVNNLD